MGSAAIKKTYTTIQDISTAAQGEAVAGSQSVQALPYSVAIGEGGQYSLSITDTGAKESISSLNSIVGNLLGIQSQMAQGIFELAPAVAAQTASEQSGMFTSKLTELGTGLSELGTKVGMETKESSKLILYGLLILGFIFLLKRK
jgi:hypothetical protein